MTTTLQRNYRCYVAVIADQHRAQLTLDLRSR